jgi:zinc transporter 1/2/3
MLSKLSNLALIAMVFSPYVRADDTDSAPDTGSCAPTSAENYNQKLHIIAVFVMLVASGLGVGFPVFFGKQVRPWAQNVFFTLKFFGTGVIISLAFVLLAHL